MIGAGGRSWGCDGDLLGVVVGLPMTIRIPSGGLSPGASRRVRLDPGSQRPIQVGGGTAADRLDAGWVLLTDSSRTVMVIPGRVVVSL